MDTSLKITLLLYFLQFPLYLHIILYPLQDLSPKPVYNNLQG